MPIVEKNGLSYDLTENDFADMLKGNLSPENIFVRRNDGTSAHKVIIMRIDEAIDNNKISSKRGFSLAKIDRKSTAKFGLLAGTIFGTYILARKFWKKHKAAQTDEMCKDQDGEDNQNQKGTILQCEIGSKVIEFSIENENASDEDRKPLTQEEAVLELVRIFIGMIETMDGMKKISEGFEYLSNATEIDKNALLDLLSSPDDLESFLSQNKQFMLRNRDVLCNYFGIEVMDNIQFNLTSMTDIESIRVADNAKEE